MRKREKIVTTTTPPLTEQPLHEKGETGAFLWKREKEGNMLGTDTRDLGPMSTYPSRTQKEGMLAELKEALKLHERQLRKP